MGAVYSRLVQQPLDACVQGIAHLIDGSRKRRRCNESTGRCRTNDNDDDDDDADNLCELMCAPKRKKLCTTQYIYQTLFVEQRSSDIAVHALGKVWNLHKIFLCQSPYFASLFSGAWRERSSDRMANMEILDPQITLAGLETVFGSLYNNEVLIDPKRVVAVLATATLFQLDGLIERCGEVMTETIMPETVIGYHTQASAYGLRSVQAATFRWLLVNLVSYHKKNAQWLRTIPIELMAQLVRSPDLVLVETECSLYLMLRVWMFMLVGQADATAAAAEDDDDDDDDDDDYRDDNTSTSAASVPPAFDAATNETPDTDGSNSSSSVPPHLGPISMKTLRSTYTELACRTVIRDFADDEGAVSHLMRAQQHKVAFLETPAGRRFVPLFRQLRFQHLLSHPLDMVMVVHDNVVPMSWLQRPLFEQWHSMLLVDSTIDDGPTECSRDTFERLCSRFGRSLDAAPACGNVSKWRWTSFCFGLDLLLCIDRRVLSVKRNHRADHERMLSLRTTRNLMIRVTVYSLNAHRQVQHQQSTDILSLSMLRNAEERLISFDANMQYPLMVSVNALLTTPGKIPAELAPRWSEFVPSPGDED